MRIEAVPRALLATLALAALALGWARFAPREPLLARFPASTAVYAADGSLLRLTLASDGTYRLPARLDAISPRLVRAVLLHEDRGFFHHPGVDGTALLRGAYRSFVLRDRRVGGSTITMQLARRIHGIDSSRIPGKLRQIALALLLEARYDKHEILEAYLNLAPYGGNVEGVPAASLAWFGRRARDLTLPEALALAVIPQSPARRAPRADNRELEVARRGIAAEWRAWFGSTLEEDAALAAPLVPRRLADLPFRAPHATQALLAEQWRRGSPYLTAAPSVSHEIRSTIDPALQRLLEQRVAAYVERQRRFGVRNAAALLVDTRDMSVVASVGSASFQDAAIQGQNDGTRARRSPGSTLKPFIYALAIDQGLAHPASVLKDTPQSFGPFSPENFDGEFSGPVTMQEALVRSRNVPAVDVGLRLSSPSFHQFLRHAGVPDLRAAEHYGLALFLGGAELPMRDLARLYAMLANGGELRGLRDRVDEPAARGVRVLSEAASFVTLDMLAHNPRPARAFANDAIRAGAPVYWKTGTSNGFRDAWSAGVFDQYVLVVWLGNFDGEPNPALVGVQMAAPLFFSVVDAVRARRPARAGEPDRPLLMLRPPAGVQRVTVCAASGDLPNAWCDRLASTWYLPGVSPIRVSQLHRPVWIDSRTGLQACPPYDRPGVQAQVFEFWSSDMLELYARAGLPRRTPPPRDPSCAATLAATEADASSGDGRDPTIVSPLAEVTYLLASDASQPPLALRAISDAGVRELFWFADDAFLGRTAPDQALEWRPPASGAYWLRVVDDAGRSAGRRLRVAAADAEPRPAASVETLQATRARLPSK